MTYLQGKMLYILRIRRTNRKRRRRRRNWGWWISERISVLSKSQTCIVEEAIYSET